MAKNTTPLLLIIGVIAMLAGLWLAQSTKTDTSASVPARIQGAIYPSAKIIHPFKLINHKGAEFSNKDLNGHWNIIFIGYTHCPDVCPTTLSLMSEVHQKLSQQKIQAPNVIFLSIDPERDTAEIMNTYVEYFNTEFTGITGSLTVINKFSRNLNAVFRKAPGLSGKITKDDYLMDHSSALMLLNPEGKLQAILTAPHTVDGVIDSITKTEAYYSGIN